MGCCRRIDPDGDWLFGGFGWFTDEALRVCAEGAIEGFLTGGVDRIGLRSLSATVNVWRRGRGDNSGEAAIGPATIVGLRPSSVAGPIAAADAVFLSGITT